MSEGSDAGSDSQRNVLPLVEPLRRYALSRTRDSHDADDVVQETLTRVLAARRDLEPNSLLAYAIVIARNLLTSDVRGAQRARRMAPKVVDLRQPERPDDTVVDREEQSALAEALAGLPADQRGTLVAHEVHDVPVISLASSTGTSPAALAAQLARTRARLRVDYLLALRREELPTPRCRPVLLAMSLGDRRRQEALGAGNHLLTCRVCSELSEPLLERKRALAGLVPLLPVGGVLEWLKRVGAKPAVAGSVATGLAAGVATVVLLATDPFGGSGAPAPSASDPSADGVQASSPAPSDGSAAGAASGSPTAPSGAAQAPGPVPLAASGRICSATEPATTLAGLVTGRTARCERGLVLDVPADEGFWVRSGPDTRIWVQLTGAGESPAWIRINQRVSFVGAFVRHGADFPAQVGLDPVRGAADLRGQGVHIEVAAEDLTIVTPAP